MKKTTMKAKVFAAILAAVTACSVTTAAMATTVSAAQLETTQTFENNMKKVGVDAADAAFDTIADLIPGGKILISPFKSVFHIGVDDPDPMEEIGKKLDLIDNKLDQIDSKLEDLNESINKNTQWMAEKIQNTADMSDLRSDFKGLSPQVAKFIKDVKAAETNKNLNKAQKIMRLAALTDSSRYDSITTYVYNIMKSMDGTDPAYVDMFKALYTRSAIKKMFAREAYREALPTAQALTAQYVYAVMLMQECQTAAKAVSQFKAEDIASLGEYELGLYKSFDQYRHSLDDSEPAAALVAAANGVNRFKEKYDRPAYINKNASTTGRYFELGNSSGYEYVWTKTNSNHLDIEGKVKSNSLSASELGTIAAYVRENYKDRSLYEFLVDDMGVKSNISSNSYMIVGDKINVSKTRNKSIDKSFNGTYDCIGYDRVGSIQAIKMNDKSKTVTNLTLYTYQSWDDDWCSWLLGTYYDFRTSSADLKYINMLRVYNA